MATPHHHILNTGSTMQEEPPHGRTAIADVGTQYSHLNAAQMHDGTDDPVQPYHLSSCKGMDEGQGQHRQLQDP